MSAAVQQRLRRLECLRGAAAFYVFLHHYVHVVVTPHEPRLAFFFKFGQFAVILFFVVSGFVIDYSTFLKSPEVPFRSYFLRRFRRIYPPFVFCLAATYLGACVTEGGLVDPDLPQLVGNLLMLQDANVASWFQPYLGNVSLWSLSYEWCFYFVYFAMYKASGSVETRRWMAVGLGVLGTATYWALPNQISVFLAYYPMWWAGAEIARELVTHGTVTFKRQLVPMASITLQIGLWGIPVVLAWRAGEHLDAWEHPVMEMRHFITGLVVVGAGLAWHRLGWRGFYQALGVFERIAPISYGLYIIHYPVLLVASHFSDVTGPWLPFLWVLPAVLGLAYLIEIRAQKFVLPLIPTS